MDKFTKYPVFMQVFVYLSCATSTAVWQNAKIKVELTFRKKNKINY
jgi:hypothetical protein